MDNDESFTSLEEQEGSRPNSSLSTISEGSEPENQELQFARSQEVSELPEVFESVQDSPPNADSNNNRDSQVGFDVARETEHEPLERQLANITINDHVVPTHHQRRSQSWPRSFQSSETLPTTPRILPLLPSERAQNRARDYLGELFSREVVSSGRLGPNTTFRVEVTRRFGANGQPQVEESEDNDDPENPTDARERMRRFQRMGFDCYWLPDNRWKFGYRVVRSCRLSINHSMLRSTPRFNGNGEFRQIGNRSDCFSKRYAAPRFQFTVPNDGQPFDMFCDRIYRRGVNSAFYRMALTLVMFWQQQINALLEFFIILLERIFQYRRMQVQNLGAKKNGKKPGKK